MATIACSVSPVRYCFYGSDRLVPIFSLWVFVFSWLDWRRTHACCWLNLLLYACSTHGESTRIENLVLCYSLDSPRTPRPLSMATIACSVSPVRYCFYGLDRLVPIFHYEFLWHACCWLNLLLYACSTYGESTRIKKSGIVLQARFSTHAAGGLNACMHRRSCNACSR